MNNLPRGFLRIIRINVAFDRFHELIKQPIVTQEQRQIALNIIKRIFVHYWKLLRDLLQEKGITEYYPRNIFTLAAANNIIPQSSLVWIDYIDLLNKLIYEENNNSEEIVSNIINTFTIELKNTYKQINSLYPELKNLDLSGTKNIDDLPKEQPLYTPEEIGILKDSYLNLIDYLSQNKEIKNVWLHGSRAKKTAKNTSDIDLLIDCPLDIFETIKLQLFKLRIPYRIDAANIYDNTNTFFLSQAIDSAKIIYRAIDFENI